jgi:hypothetical protein
MARSGHPRAFSKDGTSGRSYSMPPADTFGSRIHLEPETPMNKFVIERPIPGVGSLTRDELHAASTTSCRVLDELGPDIQWIQSYVTDDKIYCVYLAANEQLIREHAQRAGFPAEAISAVRALIDPTMRLPQTVKAAAA